MNPPSTTHPRFLTPKETVILLACLAIGLATLSTSAVAHSPVNNIGFSFEQDEQLRVGEVNGLPRNLAVSTAQGFAQELNGVAGSWFDVTVVDVGQSSSTFRTACDVPTKNIYFYVDSIDGPGGTTGIGSQCIAGGHAVRARMMIDSLDNNHWYATHPASNQIDARSTGIHELTHAAGFKNHVPDTSTYCPQNTQMHVMCSGAKRGEDWKRDYQYHDFEVLLDMY